MTDDGTPDLSGFGEFLTVAEITDILRTSKMTVYRLVNTGELESKRVGRSIRVPVESFKTYLRS